MNISLSVADLVSIAPLLLVFIGALGCLVLESISEECAKKYCFPLVLFFLVAALYASAAVPESTSSLLTPWLKFDSLSRFFSLFFLLVGVGTVFLSYSFFAQFPAIQGAYYFLLLSSIFGLMLIGSSADFLSLFLGLETLSIALYVLCGYMKKWEISNESSIKYFLLGSLATAFFLYGIGLIYGAVGDTNFDGLLSGYKSLEGKSMQALFLSGIALVTLGLAFKAAIVPFHIWAPDVYEGAPTPITAFMAIGTKAGAFAGFVRLFLEALPRFEPYWNEGIALLAIPTLIYANAVAMRQVQLRRFFAYSGISHAGFLLLPIAVGTEEALPALLFYLVVYGLATLGCFAVLVGLDKHKEGVFIRDLQGLYRHSPYLAGVLTLCLLTLAGIPPTAGFFAKFYLFKTAFQAGYYVLVIVALLTTIFAAYYYLRIIGVMFAEAPKEAISPRRSWPALLVGASSLVFIVILSFYPAPLMHLLDLNK